MASNILKNIDKVAIRLNPGSQMGTTLASLAGFSIFTIREKLSTTSDNGTSVTYGSGDIRVTSEKVTLDFKIDLDEVSRTAFETTFKNNKCDIIFMESEDFVTSTYDKFYGLTNVTLNGKLSLVSNDDCTYNITAEKSARSTANVIKYVTMTAITGGTIVA